MIIQVVVDDRGDRLAALRKARERYNIECAGAPGFALIADDQGFVQKLVDDAAESYAVRYIRRPQTLAEALSRIDDLEKKNATLTALTTQQAAEPLAEA